MVGLGSRDSVVFFLWQLIDRDVVELMSLTVE
jgi:hypothetical protein